MAIRSFRQVGRKAVWLGLCLGGMVVLGWVVGWIPAVATFLSLPVLTTGASMWFFPGPITDAVSIDDAWARTRAATKLLWLAGMALGVLAMMAGVFFVMAPATSP